MSSSPTMDNNCSTSTMDNEDREQQEQEEKARLITQVPKKE